MAYFNFVFWFLFNLSITDKHTCLFYAALDISALLEMSIITIYTFILLEKDYILDSVPRLQNIYGTLISSEEVLINKQDRTLHSRLLGGVCSYSCSTN